MEELRIGCVPYLNAKPLIEGLEGARVTLLPPSRLIPLLAGDRLDVALIPSIEVLRAGYSFVPGIAIASPGKVDSVRLHHRVEIPDVRRVSLDPESRTSNALTKIILEKRYGLKPRYALGGRKWDAAVTIGDKSFRTARWPYLDLGTEWRAMTGLPFVYALWAYRPGHPRAADIRRVLRRSKEIGTSRIGEIADRESKRLGKSEQFCRRYLTEYITFNFGREERAGLRLFGKYLP